MKRINSVGMVQGDGVRPAMVKSETHFHSRSGVARKTEVEREKRKNKALSG